MTNFEKFSNIISSINAENMLPKKQMINLGDIDEQLKAIQEMDRLRLLSEQAKERVKEQREIQLNQMIQQIVENTAYLPEMVGLVRKNNEINEEMLTLFQEMTEVMKAQTPEEAEGIIKNVVAKAMETNDALDAASGLLNYGKLLMKFAFPEA